MVVDSSSPQQRDELAERLAELERREDALEQRCAELDARDANVSGIKILGVSVAILIALLLVVGFLVTFATA